MVEQELPQIRLREQLYQLTSEGTWPAAPLLWLKTTVCLPTATEHDCSDVVLYHHLMFVDWPHTDISTRTSLTRSVKGISDSAPRIETLLAMVGASVSNIKLHAHNNVVDKSVR